MRPSKSRTCLGLTQPCYASRNFHDDAKLLTNIRKYHELCPANLDAYLHLNKIIGAAEAPGWTRQLRALLEKSTNPNDGAYWKILWTAEFRAVPESGFEAVRKRVAADVQRLASRPGPRKRSMLTALVDGYNLSGQPEAAAAAGKTFTVEEEALKAYRTLEEKYQLRTSRMTPEEHEAFMKVYAKAAAEWIEKWPESASAWHFRLATVTHLPDWTKEDLERAGDEVLKADAASEMGWSYVPDNHVAKAWLQHGIRPNESVKLAEEAFQQISLGPEEKNDLYAPPDQPVTSPHTFGFDITLWDAMAAVVEGSIQVSDFDKAHRMLGRMSYWLHQNEAKRDDQTSAYNRSEGQFLSSQGKTAEAEGHKLDAISYYAKAIAAGSWDRDIAKHARELWDQEGGTAEAWRTITARIPRPIPTPPSQTKSASSSVTDFYAWNPVSKQLPEFNLRGYAGANWTLANFKGKTTFVNIWATWCPPCREELPMVQKLYELTKGRDDIQVITFNVDENPGELKPFLTTNGYTFPIMMDARQYIEAVTGPFSIPQNWLVDTNGFLREKNTGFDNKAKDWPKQSLDKLTALLTAN